MTNAKFVTASDSLDSWRDEVLTGKPPTFYKIADSGPLARIEVGPKLITLFGGAPGSGKTAFVMQSVVDALRLNPTLRAVVCNIEMPPEVLLDRQLSRLSGVPLNFIRYRTLNAHHADRIDVAMGTIESVADRLCFVRPPFDLANAAAAATAFTEGHSGGVLLVFDYIQRIAPPGELGDKRGNVDATMSFLRMFADAGAAVIVVSAVGRQKDSKGRSSYSADSMNLASFKESGELEFGADDAFILAPSAEESGIRDLKHLKARHTEPVDISLRFEGAIQAFEAIEPGTTDPHGFSAALNELWDRTDGGGDSWD
ncbi:replicative DNA helicase [Rosistilla ulvae]|uniref:Replicative DNA helicase n=1 Tax=Rosistilla ulvae TaxID=1930277 RepID=A0A517LU06_9BACT|nr:DnaB-like helicase C-terminal domain-containing protein [Rosistilla ulvae]QDS86105.1 replicative DNA helicase [Rosistilla ulvae]